VPCRICGGATTVAFSTRDRNRSLSSERFTYVRCATCRTLALERIPSDLDAYYPPDYYRVPEKREELMGATGPERYKVEIVRRHAPGGRLVEIGPAIGAFVALAQEAGYEASAIEMDAECCRFLRDVLGVPTTHTDDPGGALSENGPFEVIALWQVIEHVSDPVELLAAAAGALAPGGVVALAAPNPDALQFRLFGRRWTHVDAPRHLFLLPIEVIEGLARRFGLEVALVTTRDPGALGWNLFGWRESLANLIRGRYLQGGMRVAGSVLSRAMRPIERRDRLGSTYTMVLRKPQSNS
jgi:SAM-dependent methyltransferase